MKGALISVIIPVYNVEKYLERCVNSVQNQTYKNIEIILVDDGSTDNSPAICDRLSKSDLRINVIHTKNQGVSKARNIGIESASGDYIGFVDSDDWIESDMYEILLDKLEANGADISQCSFNYVYDSGEKIIPGINPEEFKIYDRKDGLEAFLNEEFISGVWNKLFTKELIEDIRFEIDKSMAEDVYFAFNAFLKCRKSVAVSDIKYNYFLREDSATNKVFDHNSMQCIEFDNLMLDTIKAEYPHLIKPAENRLARTCIHLACKIRQDNVQQEYKKQYEYLMNFIKQYSKKFKISDKFTLKNKVLMLAVKVNRKFFDLIVDTWLLINKIQSRGVYNNEK